MLLWTPFVPSLCPVCREIWADVCDGKDPSQQTMSRLKRGFFFFSLRSLLVRCKFTWPFNSSLHKLLSFVQRLLFGHIRRHCCLGHSSGMLSSGVYVRRPFFLAQPQSLDRSCERHQATTTTLYVAMCRNIFFFPAIWTNTKYPSEERCSWCLHNGTLVLS